MKCFFLRDESKLLPIAIPVLLSTSQTTHYAIRATTLSLVGELAEWIDRHPDTLELVLRFILDGLNILEVATYAAKAVQRVCLKCKQRMAPHIVLLLQVIQAADNLGISNDAILGLLKGITEVLTKMPSGEMTVGIQSLCNLHVTTLHQVTSPSPSLPLLNAISSTAKWGWVKRQFLRPLRLAGSVSSHISVQCYGFGSWTNTSLCPSGAGGVACC